MTVFIQELDVLHVVAPSVSVAKQIIAGELAGAKENLALLISMAQKLPGHESAVALMNQALSELSADGDAALAQAIMMTLGDTVAYRVMRDGDLNLEAFAQTIRANPELSYVKLLNMVA